MIRRGVTNRLERSRPGGVTRGLHYLRTLRIWKPEENSERADHRCERKSELEKTEGSVTRMTDPPRHIEAISPKFKSHCIG